MQLLFCSTLCLGIICTSYSGYRFIYFLRSDKVAGKAVCWILGGEFVGLLIYCSFSLMELLKIIPDPLTSTVLRGIAFGSALAASIHMTHAIRKIENE